MIEYHNVIQWNPACSDLHHANRGILLPPVCHFITQISFQSHYPFKPVSDPNDFWPSGCPQGCWGQMSLKSVSPRVRAEETQRALLQAPHSRGEECKMKVVKDRLFSGFVRFMTPALSWRTTSAGINLAVHSCEPRWGISRWVPLPPGSPIIMNKGKINGTKINK